MRRSFFNHPLFLHAGEYEPSLAFTVHGNLRPSRTPSSAPLASSHVILPLQPGVVSPAERVIYRLQRLQLLLPRPFAEKVHHVHAFRDDEVLAIVDAVIDQDRKSIKVCGFDPTDLLPLCKPRGFLELTIRIAVSNRVSSAVLLDHIKYSSSEPLRALSS